MALDPLASIYDLSARIGRDFTDDTQIVRINVLLADASAAVRTYTGLEFTAAEATVRLKVGDGRVRLPQRPVNAVSAVVDTNGNAVNFTWDAGEVVTVAVNVPDAWAWEAWRNGLRWVDVTYSYGYDEVPGDIIAIVCQMAARAFGLPADESGIQSETVAGYSRTNGSVAAAGAIGMLPEEKAALERYRNKPAGKTIMLL
jgi:hypothetical protein